MNLGIGDIRTAYRKLKRHVYYDKTDLFLREKLALFESDPSFDDRLQQIKRVLNSDEPLNERKFRSWLREIDFRVTPKSIDPVTCHCLEHKGRFISNVTSDKIYSIGKVNYFIDAPIELQIISVLWIMYEGVLLDAQLGTECSGARLVPSLRCQDDTSAGLYRRYHELYAMWRDSGINKAKQLLTEDQKSVCIIGLDLQEYYYRIRLNFDELAHAIYEADCDEDIFCTHLQVGPSNLLKCLEAICRTYREKIDPLLRITHKDIGDRDTGIPIGLCCSQLLANWYLRRFDDEIKGRLRPAYYGRYVDDILIVVTTSEDPSNQANPIAYFMDRVLVRAGLLEPSRHGRYEITGHKGLFLQQEKCILQYFDAGHSIAGLVKFQKKLEENGSNFLLLPVDEADNSLEDIAYELLYDGSVNKFRSVKGMSENRYELAKHMARQTILHLLTDDPPDPKISLGLRKFFKGKNAIEFHDLWERVFTFFVIAEDRKAARLFTKQLHQEIDRVRYEGGSRITDMLMSNLKRHLDLCLSMADGLGNPLSPSAEDEDEEITAQVAFRIANLVRHHFVRMPLLNYTTYSGPLTARAIPKAVKVDTHKLKFSPRYVNFDECMLLAKSGEVKLDRGKPPFQWACEIYKEINGREVEGVEWGSIEVKGEESYEKI